MAVAAVALGATLVEKHFILDRSIGGPDAAFSMEIGEFAAVAEDVKAGEAITEKNVRSVRPGFGLHPKYLSEVIGKWFAKDCEKGVRFSLDYIAP